MRFTNITDAISILPLVAALLVGGATTTASAAPAGGRGQDATDTQAASGAAASGEAEGAQGGAAGGPAPEVPASDAPAGGAVPPAGAAPEAAAPERSAPAMQQNVLLVQGAPPVDGVEYPEAPEQPEEQATILHGFRLGYGVWFDYDSATADPDDNRSPKERFKLESPHHFLIGYEIAHRLPAGNDALNILIVGNVMVAGLEQSRVLPSANLILGFELQRALQLGVGLNLTPDKQKPGHMVLAAGWTPRSGDLYLPVHFFFVPDVDGHHRMGLTAGVTWAR